jgi:predicted transcriptional regulator
MLRNYPKFMKIDVLRCFLRINKNISRRYLKEELELGEGSVKSILNILKNKRLIKSTKKGHSLTDKGFEIQGKIINLMKIKKIKIKKIYKNYKKIGIQLKRIKNVKINYKLRDIAVRNGAEGALIFRYNNKLILPDYNKEDFKEIEKLFDVNKNDIILVTFASSYKLAEYSALSVILEINKSLKDLLDFILKK